MYNRYIPDNAGYAPVAPPPERPCSNPPGRPGLGGALGSVTRGLGSGLGGVKEGLSGLLKGAHLEDLDVGDILLALIVLFVILEDGDNLDLVITLGLMILFSLGEKEEEED